jgi:hypothetical protein
LNYFNYYTEIEETFVRRRGKHLFLSPLDWAMIETWKERGIPLHIVLRAIESVFDVFDRQPPGTRTIKSLFYCREEVDVQFAEWSKSRAGSHDDIGDASEEGDAGNEFVLDTVSAHIANAIEELRSNPHESLREDLDRAIARLEELSANLAEDPQTVDATLADIERLLERGVLSNWDGVHLKKIESEVAGQLRAFKADMEPAAYKSTFDLMLMKRLREEASIPRLGLFYL